MKKRILLVTWYYSTNCGTCLQSYALYKVLSEQYDVFFLGRRTYYRFYDSELYCKILKKIKSKLFHKRQQYNTYAYALSIHKKKFANFINENYKIQTLKTALDYSFICKKFDAFLVGSDQMWNPNLFCNTYMLDFAPSNKRKITYAASFGVDNVVEAFFPVYKKLLKRFDFISVREPRAKELVYEISGRESAVVLDPTFLLSPSEWRQFSERSNVLEQYKIPQDYIIVYFIGSSDLNYWETCKQIAKKINCHLVVIPNRVEDYEIKGSDITVVLDTCNYDFVKLIDCAKLICTDSFHSVVFSFLMDSDFFVFPRFKEGDKNSQNNRLDNIINKFNLEAQRWENSWIDNINEHLQHDYTFGYKILNKEKKKSLDYLFEVIEN